MNDNARAELNRLRLSLEEEMEIAKRITVEAKEACSNCQEWDCYGCVYGDWGREDE